MKTEEELNALKEEVETVSKKLHELTDEELAEVTGGNEAPKVIFPYLVGAVWSPIAKLVADGMGSESSINHGKRF